MTLQADEEAAAKKSNGTKYGWEPSMLVPMGHTWIPRYCSTKNKDNLTLQ